MIELSNCKVDATSAKTHEHKRNTYIYISNCVQVHLGVITQKSRKKIIASVFS